jgi:phosphoribosylformimino-5-aminoimidazole carboxamide ribonucleotide (ProFAR) isomerase
MAGINERLRDANAIYFDGVAMPQNTTTTSDRLMTTEGGNLGSMIILVRAQSEMTLADTQTITVTINDNDAETGGTDTQVCSKLITASGATVIASGGTIAEFVLPRTVKRYTSVTVASTDALISGTFDAFLSDPMGRTNV